MTHTDAVRTLAVERYLLDEMPEIERFAFEEHFFDCAECADDLRAGSTIRQAIKQGVLPEEAGRGTVPAVTATPTRRWTLVLVPWAAAAVLAIAVGYQTLVPARGPREPVQALTPVTLRPDSRGAVPTVTIGGAADTVTLALDIDAPAGSALTYVLQTSTGSRVAEGQLSTPPAGIPLLLLVPVWTLTRPRNTVLPSRARLMARRLESTDSPSPPAEPLPLTMPQAAQATSLPLRRRFVFRGNAAAFGGRFVRPDDVFLEMPGASCLPVVGGRSVATFRGPAENFKGYLSFDSATTFAEGKFDDREKAIALTHGKVKEETLVTSTRVRAEIKGSRSAPRNASRSAEWWPSFARRVPAASASNRRFRSAKWHSKAWPSTASD